MSWVVDTCVLIDVLVTVHGQWSILPARASRLLVPKLQLGKPLVRGSFGFSSPCKRNNLCPGLHLSHRLDLERFFLTTNYTNHTNKAKGP